MHFDRTRVPASFDYQTWIDRWNRMQERCLVKRAERLEDPLDVPRVARRHLVTDRDRDRM
jgi:hypothetical protein